MLAKYMKESTANAILKLACSQSTDAMCFPGTRREYNA